MKVFSYVQKIATPYLLLLAGVLLGIAFATSHYFGGFVLDSWETELTSEASLIAEQFKEKIPSTDFEKELVDLVESYSEITGDRITLIEPDGRVLAESDLNPSAMENHLLRPEVQAALSGRIEPTTRLSTTMHQRYIYVAVPIYSSGKVIGIIRLAKSLLLYDSTISKFNILLVVLTGSSFLIGLVIIFIQSSKRWNSLRKVSDELYQMSKGELKQLKKLNRKDELNVIVTAHNSLVNKINQQIKSLQDEQSRISATMNKMADGVILVNSRGIVTLINPSARNLLQIPEQTRINDSLIETVRNHKVVEIWKKAQESGRTQSETIQTSLDKANIQVTATLMGSDLHGESLLLFQDLTLLRKLETVRKDFISNISHELRTPLASLKSLTETLQGGALNDPKVSNRFLNQMNEEIDNLTQIVHELLELSKIESGQVPLEKKLTAVMELISRPIERMNLQADRAGIVIETIVPKGLPEINVDLNRIQQVFLNLIHNAIKFTQPGGKIIVSAEGKQNSIVFRVSDSGVGITQEDLPRIFERFYKSDRSRSGGGTGLGLSISKHIIEAHGGKIWAESTQGKGSTFFFSLPC